MPIYGSLILKFYRPAQLNQLVCFSIMKMYFIVSVSLTRLKHCKPKWATSFFKIYLKSRSIYMLLFGRYTANTLIIDSQVF